MKLFHKKRDEEEKQKINPSESMNQEKDTTAGQTKEKRKRLKISELFYNNHFVMVFSLVAALVLWFIMSLTNTTERPLEINDVPIEITLSPAAQEDNLKVFEQSDTTATVSVSGSSIIVNRLKASDMKAVATLYPTSSSVASGGMMEYTLTLDPRKVTNELTDYQMVSVNPKEVTVLVDKYKETVVPIEAVMQYGRNDQYYYNTPSLSVDSVTISGPESSVDKVSRVTAEYTTDEVLTSTKVFTCNLTAYDENGQKIEDKYLEYSTKQVDVTVSVFPIEKMDLKPGGVNMPSQFPTSRMKTDPSSIQVAGPEDALNNLTAISLEPVDFSSVNPNSTTFTRTVSLPTGFLNIQNIWDVEVSIDLDGYTQKTLTLNSSNVVIKNNRSGQSAEVLTEKLSVQVVGPEAQVSALTSEDLYANLDMSTQTDGSGTVNMPVSIGFTDAPGCWAYGKYTVSVQVSQE